MNNTVLLLNEKTSIQGIEKGVITASVENNWTREDGLSEYADNKLDVSATKIKFVKDYDTCRNQFFIDVFHNGEEFECIEDFYDFVTQFTYHKKHKKEKTISLKGVGRRFAMYVLSGYTMWEDGETSLYSITALIKGGFVGEANITIRKPKQQDDDVSISVKKIDSWDEWYTCSERQYLYSDMSFDTFIDDLRTSYPNNQDVEFIFEDKTNDKVISLHCYDPTYGVRFFNEEFNYLWEEAKNSKDGILIDETEDGVGYFKLDWVDSPCGKSFRVVNSILLTSFLRKEHKKDKNKEKVKAGAEHIKGGIYTFRGGRLLNKGNTKHLAPKLAHDRGGVGNCRLVLDLGDDDVANDFGINGNKSSGICSIERSELLNPNRTGFKDTTESNDRFKDKYKSKNFVPGVYDKLIRLYNDCYYNIYCEKCSESSGKTNNIDSEEGSITKKKSKKIGKTTNTNIAEKKGVLNKIGRVEAYTQYSITSNTNNISRENILSSEEFPKILDEILDYIESHGMTIDGNTHDSIISYLCDNTVNNAKQWVDSNSMMLNS